MAKNQRLAMFLMVLTVLLAAPMYVLIGFMTIPVGLGMLMLLNERPWVLNLYPFLFAGEKHDVNPIYYLDKVLSIPLTILQWLIIAWFFGLIARDFTLKWMVFSAVGLALVVSALTSAILSSAGIMVVWTGFHT